MGMAVNVGTGDGVSVVMNMMAGGTVVGVAGEEPGSEQPVNVIKPSRMIYKILFMTRSSLPLSILDCALDTTDSHSLSKH
jgi:hypothetical protein